MRAPSIIILQYTWPALTVVFSRFVLKERLTTAAVFATITAVAAITVASQTGSGTKPLLAHWCLALTAAFVFAGYTTWAKKQAYEPFSSVAITFAAAAGLSFLSMMLLAGWRVPAGKAVFLVLINGLFVNGLSYVWWLQALRMAPVSFVAPWVSLTPVMAAFVMYFRGHSVGEWQWAGLGLILISVLCASGPSTGRKIRSREHPQATELSSRVRAQVAHFWPLLDVPRGISRH
jgi:drug/metabolite transporter (DMT)-like permease